MSETNPTPTQQGETLERCPLDHAEEKGLHINSSSGMRKWHITCFDCGLYLEGMLDETIRSLAQRWNTRRAAVAGPRNDALLEIIKQVTQKHHQSRTHPPTYCCPEDESVYDRLFARMLVEAIDAATASPAPAESDKTRCGPARPDDGSECLYGVCPRPRDGCSEYCWQHHKSQYAPPESTRAAGEQSNVVSVNVDVDERGEIVFGDTSDSARRAAEEISSTFGLRFQEDSLQRTAAIINRAFAAAPADNDALEVCRLLTTLDWIVGYELAGENQLILDRAQELALKVMGMSDPPTTTKEDR